MKTEQVPFGKTPTAYNGATPRKTASQKYSYIFKGWDPEITSVTGEATYTAQFDKTENPVVAYIDANGKVHNDLNHSTETTDDDGVQAIPLDGTETTLGQSGTDPNTSKPYETWYICNTPATANNGKGLTYNGTLTLYGNVHLILADNSAMTVNKNVGWGIQSYYYEASNLTIYGQGGIDNQGKSIEGSLTASICVNNFTVNGGKISATGTYEHFEDKDVWSIYEPIYADKDITINGGKITADATN